MSDHQIETRLKCWSRLYLKYSRQYFKVCWIVLFFHLKNWNNGGSEQMKTNSKILSLSSP